MSMFTLALSCLITSNLPWFMNLTYQVPMQYCSLQHRTLFPSCHIHNWTLFLLWLHLFILSGVILHSSPVVYWAPTNLGSPFSMSYLFVFSYCSWGSQGNNAEVVCHFLLQWTTFCQNSLLWLVHLGWPYMAWLIVSLSQTRLWFMWSVWLLFCDCDFHSVCPLRIRTRGLWKLPDGRD